jgi:hypothetical protein
MNRQWHHIDAGPTLCVSCDHSIENHNVGGCYVDMGRAFCACQAEPPAFTLGAGGNKHD